MSSSAGQLEDVLRGRTICMLYGWRLEYATRLVREIAALTAAGARVVVFSPFVDEDRLPDGVQGVSPAPYSLPASEDQLRAIRIASNMIRNVVRSIRSRGAAERQLRQLFEESETDLVWAIDWPMLKKYGHVARRSHIPIIYETLDLVAEQTTDSEAESAMELAELLRADALITAGSSFADYYEAKIRSAGGSLRPVVIDNAPEEMVTDCRRTSRPLRLLFLGALTKNRNLPNLLRAMAMVSQDLTLTLMGEDRLDGTLAELIDDLQLRDRVRIEPPVPPDEIIAAASDYDVGVISLEPVTLNERLAPTTKLQTYLAAGMAVVASDLPGVADVIRRNEVGWLVPGGAPSEWAAVLDTIGGLSTEEIEEYRARSLVAASRYSWSAQKPLFLAEFARAMMRR